MLFFILTLGAAVCFAFGNVLAKSGVAKSGEKADIHHPIRFIVSFLTSKRWWTGFCLSALGNVGNYTAMALYNLSLVKPISALNPVLTAIFGRIFLKEPINRRVVAAIVCVLCGLLFASSEVGEAPGVQNIPALCIFVGILLAFAFASHFIFRSPEVGDSITMGTCYGLPMYCTKALRSTPPPRAFNFRQMNFCTGLRTCACGPLLQPISPHSFLRKLRSPAAEPCSSFRSARQSEPSFRFLQAHSFLQNRSRPQKS